MTRLEAPAVDSEVEVTIDSFPLGNASDELERNASGSLIQIDIIDSGAGFTESDLPHVFKRLYRGDPSRQKSPGTSEPCTIVGSSGSGLGLSIVQQIIQAHGGTVQAKNHPETGGAWLQIQLPDRKNLL